MAVSQSGLPILPAGGLPTGEVLRVAREFAPLFEKNQWAWAHGVGIPNAGEIANTIHNLWALMQNDGVLETESGRVHIQYAPESGRVHIPARRDDGFRERTRPLPRRNQVIENKRIREPWSVETLPTEDELAEGVDAFEILPDLSTVQGMRVLIRITPLGPADDVPAPRKKSAYGAPCPTCKAKPELCDWCDTKAKHFAVTKRTGERHACDEHKPLLVDVLPSEAENAGDDTMRFLYEDLEVGAYTPGKNGCKCDPWG